MANLSKPAQTILLMSLLSVTAIMAGFIGFQMKSFSAASAPSSLKGEEQRNSSTDSTDSKQKAEESQESIPSLENWTLVGSKSNVREFRLQLDANSGEKIWVTVDQNPMGVLLEEYWGGMADTSSQWPKIYPTQKYTDDDGETTWIIDDIKESPNEVSRVIAIGNQARFIVLKYTCPQKELAACTLSKEDLKNYMTRVSKAELD